jgi:hypothetical protein
MSRSVPPVNALGSPTSPVVDPEPVPRSRFRPPARRRGRIAAGAGLAAAAIVGNVAVYASLDDRVTVLQLVSDVRAGDVVQAADLRVVEITVEQTVPTVGAAELDLVVGQYARVHLASGSLLAPVLVQPEPLVAPGRAVVAVEIRPTLVPEGVRERSLIELVVTGRDEVARVRGRVVTRPSESDGVTGTVSLSVEVDPDDAASVAAADSIRIVLLEPDEDPAYPGVAG